MQITPTTIPGAWVVTPKMFGDDRGTFLEVFRSDVFRETTGHTFDLAQANCSVSDRGVLRGIHFADVPPGQAKYATCLVGTVLDVVVDIRVGSPTFGQWDSVILDTKDRRAIYLSEGLGHAFLSLEDGSTVMYLCSAPFAPDREHEVNPLDPQIGIAWPKDVDRIISAKDSAAPSLAEAQAAGLLPTFDAVTKYVAELGTTG